MQIITFKYVQDNLTNVTFQRIVFTPPKMVKIKKMNIEKYVLYFVKKLLENSLLSKLKI